ncbi:hypothetical protein [Ferrimonas balearica]|uniref:hypothetical protein n=1 Tax=Ferrimonas balearica TaxID=44012 RepID=UPI001C9971E8|nr:hypothetical protein [Ferrimonas balearica]MBY5992524.1 hypothetical protein [Ferrimonas balearica]
MTGHRIVIVALWLSVGATSAVLTWDFMSSVGEAIGLGLVMGFLGVSLDAAKLYLPVCAHRLCGNQVARGFFWCMTMCLVAVSFAAPMFAMDNGYRDGFAARSAESIVEQQKNSLEREQTMISIKQYQELAQAQISSGHISRAVETNDKIAALVDSMEVNSAPEVEPSLLDEYGTLAFVVSAAAIEIVGLSLAIAFAASAEAPTRAKALTHKVQEVSKPKPVSKPAPKPDPKPEPKPEVKEAEPELIGHAMVRRAILDGEVSASVHEVRKRFKSDTIKESEISPLILKMSEAGELTKVGRSWKVAKT